MWIWSILWNSFEKWNLVTLLVKFESINQVFVLTFLETVSSWCSAEWVIFRSSSFIGICFNMSVGRRTWTFLNLSKSICLTFNEYLNEKENTYFGDCMICLSESVIWKILRRRRLLLFNRRSFLCWSTKRSRNLRLLFNSRHPRLQRMIFLFLINRWSWNTRFLPIRNKSIRFSNFPLKNNFTHN